MNADRLLSVADLLRHPKRWPKLKGLVPQFNIESWAFVQFDDAGEVCGTAACACGLACLAFPEWGWQLLTPDDADDPTGECAITDQYRDQADGYKIGQQVFGLSESDFINLFGVGSYSSEGKLKPIVVAERIEEFVRTGGSYASV